MIDLNDMVIFAKVAEQGGISRAAALLDIPKSKVSRRITRLEAALNTRLLERSTRSVRITEAGKLYLQHCQRIIEEVQSAEASLNRLTEKPVGHLRISTSVLIGQQLIAPSLSEFLTRFPDMTVDLHLVNRRVDLIAEGYDLVIRVGDLQDSQLISKPIGSVRAKPVASPAYLEKSGTPQTPQDLALHKTLAMTDARRSTDWLLEDHKGNKTSVSITPGLVINDFNAIRTVVQRGGGIALLQDYLVDDLIKTGQLIRVLPHWQSPEIIYHAVYPSRLGLTHKTGAWLNFFKEKLQQISG